MEPEYTPTKPDILGIEQSEEFDTNLLRFPDVAEYDPLARLEWGEHDDREYKESELSVPLFTMTITHPWLALHYKDCARDIDAIVDGKAQRICRKCSPEWCMVADVEEVQVEVIKQAA